MFTTQEKAAIVQEFIRTGSITLTRRWVSRTMDREPPSGQSIRRWRRNFIETGTVQDRTRSGRPRSSAEKLNVVTHLFSTEPMTSLRNAEAQLQIPRSTIQRILKQLLSWYPYKIQTLQALSSIDRQRRLQFAQHVLSQPCGASEYLSKIFVSDECILRVNGYVNKQNIRVFK